MTNLIDAKEYQLNATVRPLLTPKGSYRLRMASTNSVARNPKEERVVLDLILDEAAVRRLAYELLVNVDQEEVSHMKAA